MVLFFLGGGITWILQYIRMDQKNFTDTVGGSLKIYKTWKISKGPPPGKKWHFPNNDVSLNVLIACINIINIYNVHLLIFDMVNGLCKCYPLFHVIMLTWYRSNVDTGHWKLDDHTGIFENACNLPDESKKARCLTISMPRFQQLVQAGEAGAEFASS